MGRARQPGADLARPAGLLARRDPGEDVARRLPRAFAPQGAVSEATSVACERRMTPSSSGFSALAAKRRAGGRDVDDELGRARGRRALGRAQALDDAIVGDAMFGEKAAGQVDVFGRDPHPLAALGAIGRGDVVEIGHRAHVDPGLRRGDHHVGVAEAERAQELEPRLDVGNLLAHQILAGDAEMGAGRRRAGRRSRPTRR